MEEKQYKLQERLLDNYFQKSYKFIFPLLQIKTTPALRPVQTYLMWLDHVKKEDYKLICVFNLQNTPEFKKYEVAELFNNKLFHDFKLLEGEKGAYLFSLDIFRDDMDHFYNGNYSKISESRKKTLLQYYSQNSYSREYFDSFLYPEKYYEIYAKHLDQDIETIKESGELCNKYDVNKERLMIKEVILNFEMNNL